MPEISRFFGIIISIFYDEHNPPHFHARYGEYVVVVGIENLLRSCQESRCKFPAGRRTLRPLPAIVALGANATDVV